MHVSEAETETEASCCVLRRLRPSRTRAWGSALSAALCCTLLHSPCAVAETGAALRVVFVAGDDGVRVHPVVLDRPRAAVVAPPGLQPRGHRRGHCALAPPTLVARPPHDRLQERHRRLLRPRVPEQGLRRVCASIFQHTRCPALTLACGLGCLAPSSVFALA
eukprot:3252978-Rhodomonas_salina.1